MKLTDSFKVVAVSSNTNSFGLYQVIMINKKGRAYKACHGAVGLPKRGDDIILSQTIKDGGEVTDSWNFAEHGFEIPKRAPDAPKDVINEVFGAKKSN